jgi:phosphopantothenoylcysteine decarboxylase/phosphopantothenate--cysteine ligase
MHYPFAGKRILLGLTGSIALFKVAGWASSLAKEEALVDIVMTESARQFVTPLTFSSLTGRQVYDDMFRAEREGAISHISLGREVDCILVAPATAQTIARLAHGFADDLLSTTVLAANVPIIVCPAMNVKMYEHPATRKNIETLKSFGYIVIEPGAGSLACGDEGAGRLPEWEEVAEYVLRELSTKDLAGQDFLITGGPTREPLDPARYISNPSSGKMGFALARAAFRRGAGVTLVHGPTSLDQPAGVDCVEVSTAREMYDEVMLRFQKASVIIKAAAVADFRPVVNHAEKVKKNEASLELELEPTVDILRELGQKREPANQLLVGFAAESRDIENEGRKKLESKLLDLIAVNDIGSSQTGFAVDSNQLILVSREQSKTLPHTSKIKTADLMLDYLVENDLLRT